MSVGLSDALTEDRFEAVIFDWDGTAVPDRRADAARVRARVEQLCAAGVHVFVVSGTHLDNVDGQLRARPTGPGSLFFAFYESTARRETSRYSGGEFLARYCPNATGIELGVGPIGSHLARLCQDEHADLIVLSWSQDSSPGRAQVIRWALGHATVPILLLPVDDA